MSNSKLTDSEIKKALECCADYKNTKCKGCPLEESCVDNNICELALDLINRLKCKNSNLTSDLTSLQNDLTSAKAEIERLTIRLRKAEHQLDDLCKMYHIIKAEAYKECIEKVKAYYKETRFAYDAYNLGEELDNLLKELVGE